VLTNGDYGYGEVCEKMLELIENESMRVNISIIVYVLPSSKRKIY
jgi:hypothetical protein